MSQRKKASTILHEFNKFYGCDKEQKVTLRSVDSVLQLLRSSPSEAAKEFKRWHAAEIDLCHYNIASIALLSIVACQSKYKRVILRKDYPASDANLCGFAANISNSAQAALTLVLDGFDTQARALLRTLDERICQAFILFRSAEDYKMWHAGESTDDAKRAHYQLFSRKSRLQKKVRAIEEEYLSSKADLEVLAAWRKETDDFYSMAVHGAVAAVMVGSWAFKFESDEVLFPNVFGCASSAASSTINHLVFQLYHFNHIFPMILRQVHGWEASKEDDMEREFMAFNVLSYNLSMEWISGKNNDA